MEVFFANDSALQQNYPPHSTPRRTVRLNAATKISNLTCGLICNYMQDDWAKWVSMAEFADNDVVSSSTGVTPFYANKEFHLRMRFSSDSKSYESTRKRLDAAKAENIAGNM